MMVNYVVIAMVVMLYRQCVHNFQHVLVSNYCLMIKKTNIFFFFIDSCPINSHIERNYTDCGITCQNRAGNGTCSSVGIGCVCNSGYFLDSIAGQCVRECDCGCFDSIYNYHPVILSFFSKLHFIWFFIVKSSMEWYLCDICM